MNLTTLGAIGAALFFACAIVVAYRLLIVRTAPDEWLLVTRGGQLVRAGIGIEAIRWFGHRYVRYTSALQRLTFDVSAPAKDGVRARVGGFVLWTVDAEDDGPLVAYRSLAIANLDDPTQPFHLSPQHLLRTPQYKAFRTLIASCVTRVLARYTLEALIANRDEFVRDVERAVRDTTLGKGVALDQLQVGRLGPESETIASQLAAEREAAIERDAHRVRMNARAEMQTKEAELEAERLAERLRREEAELEASLDARRRRAEAERDAIRLVNEAEEAKSNDVRHAEVVTSVADKLLRAVAALPIQNAQLTNVGSDSGLSRLVAEIGAMMPRAANDGD